MSISEVSRSVLEPRTLPSLPRCLAGLLVQRYVPHFWLAITHLGLGNHPEALARRERACEDPDDSLLGIKIVPFLDPIRREPRFIDVLRKMALEA